MLLDANANPAPKDSTFVCFHFTNFCSNFKLFFEKFIIFSGLTPLHSAAYRGHSTVVKKLLSAGAKVDVQV